MLKIGKIVLMGDWDTQAVPKGKLAVRLVPSLAEGHGWDPTTEVMLLALQKHLEPKMTVLDFGAGVGTLGLAALKLGASKVDAVEYVPEVVEILERNISVNKAGKKLTVYREAPEKKYDLALCNLLGGESTLNVLPFLARSRLALLTVMDDHFDALSLSATLLGRKLEWVSQHTDSLHGTWGLGKLA